MSQHHADRPASSRKRELPRCNVILHGGMHEMMFVVRTIMELTRFCLAEATDKMWQAHNTGRALLLVTYKERAELYVEQFAERGLAASIESL